MTSHEGQPGKPGQEAAGGTGGVGGAGGTGGEPGGAGGPGGEGGDVYIDSRRVARWVHTLAAGFVALALAITFGLWLLSHEHDQRVKDNTRAITLISQSTLDHARDDDREGAAAIAADCVRSRKIRNLLLNEHVIVTQTGVAALDELVAKYGSRKGCSLTP